MVSTVHGAQPARSLGLLLSEGGVPGPFLSFLTLQSTELKQSYLPQNDDPFNCCIPWLYFLGDWPASKTPKDTLEKLLCSPRFNAWRLTVAYFFRALYRSCGKILQDYRMKMGLGAQRIQLPHSADWKKVPGEGGGLLKLHTVTGQNSDFLPPEQKAGVVFFGALISLPEEGSDLTRDYPFQ